MRVVFFGTPELAVPSLAAVAEVHEIPAVVVQPDKPVGRSKKPVPPAVKVWALEQGLEVAQPTKLNDGTFEAWLKAQNPDVCVLVAYGRILKQPILDVPTHGFLNLHPSLLPLYRGPSPIQTAIRDGATQSGLTVIRLDAGMDTGDILLQESMAIEPEDTGATLTERVAAAGAGLLVEGLALVESGKADYAPQDDSKATLTKLFEKQDGRIRWNQSAEAIRNLVRACIPWPVAHCQFETQTVRIHGCHAEAGKSGEEPGTLVRVDKDAIVVSTGEGLLAVTEIQPEGRRKMSAEDYMRGHEVSVGERFEDL